MKNDPTHHDLKYSEPTFKPGCPRVHEDLLAYHHGELPLLRHALAEWHLSRCPNCRKELQTMKTIGTTLKKSEMQENAGENPPLASDNLNAGLRERILTNLPSTPIDARGEGIVHRSPRWLEWCVAAGTCCILAAIILPTFSRARENARRIPNQSNLRQISPALVEDAKRGDFAADSMPPGTSGNKNELDNTAQVKDRIEIKRESFEDGNHRLGSTPGAGNSKFTTANETRLADMALTPYRRVHKEGSLTVEVERLEASSNAVETMIQKASGFVANNDLSTGNNGLQSAALEIRVPVKQFDTVVKEISALGKVQAKRVVGEDITAKVSDANEENNIVAADLRQKLAQYQKAKERAALKKRSVPDDWQQRADIRQMRIQLAQVRARLELLKKMSDYAALSVQLREKSAAVNGGGFLGDVGNTGKAAYESLQQAARLPINLLIYILVFSPFWLPILIVWRYFLRPTPRHTTD